MEVAIVFDNFDTCICYIFLMGGLQLLRLLILLLGSVLLTNVLDVYRVYLASKLFVRGGEMLVFEFYF